MEIDKLKKLDSELKENHLIKTLNDLKTEYDNLNIDSTKRCQRHDRT